MGHEVTVAPDGSRPGAASKGQAPVLISRLDDAAAGRPGALPADPLRAAERYTYIILLTSRDRQEDRLEGLRAGADDFLTKPPDPTSSRSAWKSPSVS